MSETLDRRERRELCDLFLELGPDVPTLCDGWAAMDLATHLIVRERSLRGAPGILLGDKISKLAKHTADAQAREARRGFEGVVERVADGPPIMTTLISRFINLNEFAIHHEDLRRANGLGPRADRDDLQDALWKQQKTMVKFLPGRPKGFRVELHRSGAGDGQVAAAGKGPVAVLTGEPLELALYLSGRKDAAVVELGGDEAAVAAWKAEDLGM